MKQKEVLNYINKKVRMILVNNFRYTGIVVSCDDKTLNLQDKYKKNIFIQLESIMLFEEVKDG